MTLCSEQGSRITRVPVKSGGAFYVIASVTDPNNGQEHSFDWSMSDNTLIDFDGDLTNNIFSVNPTNLSTGTYHIHVSATDNGTPALTSQSEITIRIVNNLPTLSSIIDSDNDGIMDAIEGTSDANNNGIPDYLDSYTEKFQLQTTPKGGKIETPNGLSIELGRTAFIANTHGALITQADIDSIMSVAGNIPTQDSMNNIGGFYDFVITSKSGFYGLQSPQIVIPQQTPIPNFPVYRKLMPTGWQDFVENNLNILSSAPGSKGTCPPFNDASFTPGLTPGNWCVRIAIEDGGPNDADSQINGRIVDPGGIANNPPTPINSSEPIVKSNGGGGLFNLPLYLFVLLSMTLRHAYSRVLIENLITRIQKLVHPLLH